MSNEECFSPCYSAGIATLKSVVMIDGAVARRPVREGLDIAEALPDSFVVDNRSLCPVASDLFLQRCGSECFRAVVCYDKVDKGATQS